MSSEKVIEVKNLDISFKTYAGLVHAVRGISFDLFRGETLAIVGESGSGKSVTNKAIMGILTKNALINSGEILYRGKDLTKISEKEFTKIRGSKLSMIFQDPMSSLDPVMKIGKQIMEAMIINKLADKDKAKERALELMEAVGIKDAANRFNQYPFQYSGGMRQRIVIATALACSPEILICDEPTTALDVSIQSQILELIKDIQKQFNLSVIFITHDLGVVAEVADRVAVMYAGKIVECGTVDEIFYDPRHPYTWNLMAAMPELETEQDEELLSIPGSPPNMLYPPKGDAFAERNKLAMNIDFREEPPLFKISDTHYASTWLLHPDAPKVEMPAILKRRIEKQQSRAVINNG